MVRVKELVFRREETELLRVRLARAETCIGAHPTNDVVVPAKGVPDVAALLIDDGSDGFVIRDLGRGAMAINGEAMQADECPIRPDDVLTLGDYHLVFRVREAEASSIRQTAAVELQTGTTTPARLVHDGRAIHLESPIFNIGSSPSNDLVLDDDFVSAFHCRITREQGRWTLTDQGSTNGTLVNGLRVGQAELPSPASIRIGTASVTFERIIDQAGEKNAGRVFHGMVASSPQMGRVFELIERFAPVDAPVMVTGASGSGKELVARALHDASGRAGPFLALNCGALTRSMIEAELFGHESGAFTGAGKGRKGAFEAANHGTLFLDEIGELPLDLQPKLLRSLESGTVRRVGGTRETPVQTRILAATHRNLSQLVQDGTFREDLYHRLVVLSIEIPLLCDRISDVVPLAQHFLADQSRELTLTESAQVRLREHDWPGNVRELRNVIVRAALLNDGAHIRAEDLSISDEAFDSDTAARRIRDLDGKERARIIDAIERAGGNRAQAARDLGVSKSTFHDRLKRLGIGPKFGG